VRLTDEVRESPVLHAQVDALLLLAASLHAHRVDLQAASDSWHSQIARLANRFGELIEFLDDRNEILEIWRSFAVTLRLTDPQDSVRSAWAQVGTELRARLRAGGDPLSYLEEANERAHQRIRSLLDRLGAGDLLSAEPAQVILLWDRNNKKAAASTSRSSGEISWTIQHADRTLWAALAAEPVLQHEYLSHLAPRDPSLSSGIQEGWLVEVLLIALSDSGPAGIADEFCFKRLQTLLEKLELGNPYLSGPRDFQPLALVMFGRNNGLFWRFTREVLEMEPKQEGAKQVDEVFREMKRKGKTEMGRIFESAGEAGIEGLLAALRGFP